MTRLGRSSASVLYAEAQDSAEFLTIPGFRCGHPTHKSSHKSRLQFNTLYQAQISLPSTQRLPAGQKACCRACERVAGRWKKLGKAVRQYTAKQRPGEQFWTTLN